ncbi:DUF1853 family protein [Winogradskyella sp. A3E31]|uniref:DUF1853 family protein n=1 Tax=Winogradskyella sp. A3E31 TaxID=3349637 RepID=UPI00398AD412
MSNRIQRQYSGFLNTPYLWKDDLYGLQHFKFEDTIAITIADTINYNRRLGKRVEQFLNVQLEHSKDINILAENIQIKKDRETIGELDMLFLQNHQPIHLEIAYKFYLFDPNYIRKQTLDCWIGPNRKDHLSLKIKKLKEKQLPLLYHPECKSALHQLGLSSDDIIQKICFKAQLFVPLKIDAIDISPLNKDCIYGFYLNQNNRILLEGYELYIPEKLDWLIEPHLSVQWDTYTNLKAELDALLESKRSPMLWLKDKNGSLQKCFVTWWS